MSKNSRVLRTTLGMAAAFLCVSFAVDARADAWKRVADLRAGGGAKEVVVNDTVSAFRLVCVEGEVIVNTVVVREGGKKTPHKVARKLLKGQEHVITLNTRKPVSGLRISDQARGRYIVHKR